MEYEFFDSNHQFNNYHVFKTAMSGAPVRIGRDCWIGANTVILRGVTIGDNVIIGANCLIHQDIPSNSIVTHSETLTIKPKNNCQISCFCLYLLRSVGRFGVFAS